MARHPRPLRFCSRRHGDIRNFSDVDRMISHAQPEAVLHLAGQVAMSTSVQDRRRDFETQESHLGHVQDDRLHRPRAVAQAANSFHARPGSWSRSSPHPLSANG
jgi:hypothetical protein